MADGAPVGLKAADRMQQRERLALVAGVGVRPRRAARPDRDAEHPQHHVGLLDPAAGLEERAALVAQHRPVDQPPEQRAALLDLLVDRVRPGQQRRWRS